MTTIEAAAKAAEEKYNIWRMGNSNIPPTWSELPAAFTAKLILTELAANPSESMVEAAAKIEHEQWMKWALTMLDTERISEDRHKRWLKYLVPYEELDEGTKEHDRVWARKELSAALMAAVEEK